MSIQLIECPRDAMQGWKTFIPTATKIEYINALLGVGFHTIDFGSFVSPKWIPQMADTAEVLAGIDLTKSTTKLLAIVANLRGAREAAALEKITYLGYPFSVSETFQQQNTNSTIADSLLLVEELQELCINSGKKLVVYISMGFGNPYGDPYSEQQVLDLAHRFAYLGIEIISLADTVGLATPEQVYTLTSYLVPALPSTMIGVHLHSRTENRLAKLEAALAAGCQRFDGALHGIGGCPMAGDELVGNMPTEWMISHLLEKNLAGDLSTEALTRSLKLASEIFHR